MVLDHVPPTNVQEQLFIDLIALVPGERVVSFNANLQSMKLPGEVLLTMPNIKTLFISGADLAKGFLLPNPNGPHPNTRLLPSLRLLILEKVIQLLDEDWDHLTTYLVHQTSGNQAISLVIIGGSPDLDMPPEVADEIQDLVEEFSYRQAMEAEARGCP
jgi:hypothetical protein